MSNIEVSGLNIYPIKSCAGIALEESALTDMGLEYDRQWMLVDNNGAFLSQRKNPELAIIRPAIKDDGLVVEAPGMSYLSVQFEKANEEVKQRIQVDVFKKPGSGLDQGDEAAAWFSEFLSSQVRLLRIDDRRNVSPERVIGGAASQIAFADGFPILLASEQSLAALNKNLDAPIPMNRFRPNIVVSDSELEAYDEDFWRRIKIGSLGAYVVKACDRCPIPNNDQSSGKRENNLVTAALRKSRHGRDSLSGAPGNFFGQNLVHELAESSKVSIGDGVEVVERADKRNFVLALEA